MPEASARMPVNGEGVGEVGRERGRVWRERAAAGAEAEAAAHEAASEVRVLRNCGQGGGLDAKGVASLRRMQ